MEQKREELMLIVFGYVRIMNDQYVANHLKQLIWSYCDTYLKFIENNESVFDITNWTATLQNNRFGTLQFGEFFSNRDEIICTITFKMESCMPHHCGIGLITSSFTDWNHGHDYDLNNCNDSMYLYGNGFYKTSTSFDKTLKDTNSFIKYQWFDTNEEISIKINTVSKDVIIWNAEINIQELHVDEINYVFFTKLPTDKHVNVALMFDMGKKTQTVRVVDQHFEFCEFK